MEFLMAAMSVHMLMIILEVAFALGMVIFVHELGHFAVAKLCGVKCEKFYLGFDIYGLKLLKFQWGETEYGIGILPLGGYVKMLGQDDNPSRAAEERQRSQLESDSSGQAKIDPRSYLAQSVPRRMAIISAGVIMNVIFALITASVAFRLGVPDAACTIGEVLPGEAAWRAGLRPGDKVIAIEGKTTDRVLTFSDLQEVVRVGDIDRGVRFQISRRGVAEPFWITIHPDRIEKNNRLAPTIGTRPMGMAKLSDAVAAPYSVVEKTDRFKPDDKVVAVNGSPIADYAELLGNVHNASLAPRQPIELTVERVVRDEKTRIKIPVPDNPMRTLGLVMKIGPVAAVQEGSPAQEAGLRVGDRIMRINGLPIDDPLRIPDQLHALAGQTVVLTVARDDAKGKETNEDLRMKSRKAWWYEAPLAFGNPVSIPELGVAYHVDNVVSRVGQVKYADDQDRTDRLKAGDEIVKAELIPSPSQKPDKRLEKLEPVEFSGKKPYWATFALRYLQVVPPSTNVKFTVADGRSVTIKPYDADGWFNPEIGIIPEVAVVELRGATWREAIEMGTRKTKDSLLLIYSFLDALRRGQVSMFGLGGPVEIAKQAGGAASEGISTLLLFLTMLSANLAVINFLPIPLLDGGHMVFLLLEGIRGKPVNERVVVAFHYAGFLFIISLMLFVLSLDFGLISRHTQ